MKLPPLPESLQRVAALIEAAAAPCLAFSLQPVRGAGAGESRVGGRPDLPIGADWPARRGRPLDFLLQVRLNDLSALASAHPLPPSGLLSFFYDFEDQPWGYDPDDLHGFRVIYTQEGAPLEAHPLREENHELTPFGMVFRPGLSLPFCGSRAYDRLDALAEFTADEEDAYWALATEIGLHGAPDPKGGRHRMFGHSHNVQGDMQLVAQLVTHGLYCGNATGFKDPRARELEFGADDWVLLLQVDSDDRGDFMWGDSGMLYYWIRTEDLAARRFDRVWMTLQSC